jgi:hypothetical protein
MTAESERELTHEKRATLDNDIRQQQKPTFHSFAQAEADAPRGRFTTVKKATVIGVGPPSYPKGPDWTVDPVPKEEPWGADINQMPPCGEAFEVRRSLEAKRGDDAPPLESSSPSQGVFGGSVAAPSNFPLGVERAGPPSFSKKHGNDNA